MNILLTGGGGFIGAGLLHRLLAAGHTVTAIFRHTPLPACPPQDAKRLTSLQADLARPLPELPPHDAVIHAAAHTHLTPGSTCADYLDGNLRPALALAEAASRWPGSRVVFLSTLSVYGRIVGPVLTDDAPLRQPEAYGVSKYFAELALAERAGPYALICLRMPGVVGRGYFAPWLGRVARLAASGSDITVYNPDAPFNNILDLDELHRQIEALLRAPLAGAQTTNLAAAAPLPLGEVVARIRQGLGSTSRVLVNPAPRDSFCIDVSRCQALSGLAAETAATIIDRYVAANRDLLETGL